MLDDDWSWLDSGDAQRVLEVVDERLAERDILLGALDERIELSTCARQLLCRLDPTGGSRRKEAQQLAQAFFVVCRQFDHLPT